MSSKSECLISLHINEEWTNYKGKLTEVDSIKSYTSLTFIELIKNKLQEFKNIEGNGDFDDFLDWIIGMPIENEDDIYSLAEELNCIDLIKKEDWDGIEDTDDGFVEEYELRSQEKFFYFEEINNKDSLSNHLDIEIKEIKGGNGLIKKKEFYVNGEIEKYDSIDWKSLIEPTLKSLVIPYDDPNFEREMWKIINTTGGIADNWNDLAYREYEITQNYEQGIEYAKKATQIEKSNGKYYDTVGEGYLMRQEPEKAFEYFNIAVEIDKKNNDVNEDHIKNKQIALDLINKNAEIVTEKIQENEEKKYVSSTTFNSTINRAESAFNNKDYVEAFEIYNKLLKIDPSDQNVKKRLDEIRPLYANTKQGRREKKQQEDKNIYLIGNSKLREKPKEETFEEGIKRAQATKQFQHNLALEQIRKKAESAFNDKDYVEAFEIYNELLKIDPSNQNVKKRLNEIRPLYANTKQGRREKKQQEEREIKEKINYKLKNKIPLDDEDKEEISKIKAQRTKDFWLKDFWIWLFLIGFLIFTIVKLASK
ncbi:MAG: hypothetical protein ACJ0QQ_00575 [Parvicellaceae bacterium]